MLYTAGLVARAGELVAAGFSPQEILPLVPLQQGLARGVSLLIDPAVAFAVLAVWHGFLYQLIPSYRRALAETASALPPPPTEDAEGSPARFGLYAVLVLIAVALLLLVDLASAPAFAVLFAYVGSCLWRAETGRGSVRHRYLVVLTAAGVIWVLGQAYIGAAPLERISISMNDSTVIRGQLLASPGTQQGTWFVAVSKNDIRAIAPDASASIAISSGRNEQGAYPPTLFRLLFG